MPDQIELLRDAVDAVVVRPPLWFSWFGASGGSMPPRMRRGLTEMQLRFDLVERLATVLYVSFYRRGSAAPMSATNGTGRPDPSFVSALSHANRGTGCNDPGWKLEERSGSGDVFTKGGLAFTVRGRAPSRSLVTLVLPKELLRIAPGFYTALGNRALDPRASVMRVYWNVEAAGAEPLLGAMTRLLNDRELPFRLKVANHPAAFDRCDAAVLYARKSDRGQLWPLIESVRRQVRARLGADVPAFTKRIAPGVGAADATPGGESFGMDRCRLVASALVRAALKKKSSTDARLRAIEEAFGERGLDLERPYLNPRSRDVYPSFDS